MSYKAKLSESTSVYKILNPNQDIRNHQTQIKNGFSGMGFFAFESLEREGAERLVFATVHRA